VSAEGRAARTPDGARRVVAVVGATATGKTALGEALAQALGGEVVCADSRQVFRELEIGTGKPAPEERAARPHHLFDALPLGAHASAGWYGRAAREVCDAIHAHGGLPVLVGGSGLYLEAARRGLAPSPPASPAIRARLLSEAAASGIEALHARLSAADPATAARLGTRDTQRITRALEVLEASGRPLSWWLAQAPGPAVAGEWRVIEITLAPRALSERIERRTRAMFEHGLVAETEALLAAGHGYALRALRAVGYDEAMELLAGRITRAEAEARTSLRTRQLAKRQRTWFRNRVEALRLEAAAGEERLLRGALAAAGATP
jgi:tRNA dimethylallyltransferase